MRKSTLAFSTLVGGMLVVCLAVLCTIRASRTAQETLQTNVPVTQKPFSHDFAYAPELMTEATVAPAGSTYVMHRAGKFMVAVPKNWAFDNQDPKTVIDGKTPFYLRAQNAHAFVLFDFRHNLTRTKEAMDAYAAWQKDVRTTGTRVSGTSQALYLVRDDDFGASVSTKDSERSLQYVLLVDADHAMEISASSFADSRAKHLAMRPTLEAIIKTVRHF